MYSKASAKVSVSLNRQDIIRLLEEGELTNDEVKVQISEPEAAKLLSELRSSD